MNLSDYMQMDPHLLVGLVNTELRNHSESLQDLVKTRLAAYKYTREVEYVDRFEMTSSGKINRKLLRAAEVARKSGAAG